MDTPANFPATRWSGPITTKSRNAVQRAVTLLLDELAPEAMLKRGEQPLKTVERHRTPNGCVLQAESSAVTVSWFADGANAAGLGELHVVVWNGIIARRGQPRRSANATVVKELILLPIEDGPVVSSWRSKVGDDEYTTAQLAAQCIRMLDDHMAV
jgi:hypothetical protein